jgi:hypothetical protein
MLIIRITVIALIAIGLFYALNSVNVPDGSSAEDRPGAMPVQNRLERALGR